MSRLTISKRLYITVISYWVNSLKLCNVGVPLFIQQIRILQTITGIHLSNLSQSQEKGVTYVDALKKKTKKVLREIKNKKFLTLH